MAVYGQHDSARFSKYVAVHAFFLAEHMNKGITTLSISDRLLAEHNFVRAKETVGTLSGNLTTDELSEKWCRQIDIIIRMIYSDERQALLMARELLVEMERRLMQSLSIQERGFETMQNF